MQLPGLSRRWMFSWKCKLRLTSSSCTANLTWKVMWGLGSIAKMLPTQKLFGSRDFLKKAKWNLFNSDVPMRKNLVPIFLSIVWMSKGNSKPSTKISLAQPTQLSFTISKLLWLLERLGFLYAVRSLGSAIVIKSMDLLT